MCGECPHSQACKDFGFFYVENHGVSEEVMAEVFRQSKAFFSLSIGDKMGVKADKNNRGYTPMHEQVLDPGNQTKGDTKVRASPGWRLFDTINAVSWMTTRSPIRSTTYCRMCVSRSVLSGDSKAGCKGIAWFLTPRVQSSLASQ